MVKAYAGCQAHAWQHVQTGCGDGRENCSGGESLSEVVQNDSYSLVSLIPWGALESQCVLKLSIKVCH